MIMPNTNRLLKVMNLTWPAFNEKQHLGWNIQEGAGGGKRVSSAKIAQLDLPDTEAAEYECTNLDKINYL